MSTQLKYILSQLQLPEQSVKNTIELLNEDCTIPFISRYRKDQTGNLDEVQIETISKLNAETTAKVQLGSVVKTSNGTFFISIGLGKVTIDNETIFCISASSPIGQLLLSKKKGDTIKFNGNSILLEELS